MPWTPRWPRRRLGRTLGRERSGPARLWRRGLLPRLSRSSRNPCAARWSRPGRRHPVFCGACATGPARTPSASWPPCSPACRRRRPLRFWTDFSCSWPWRNRKQPPAAGVTRIGIWARSCRTYWKVRRPSGPGWSGPWSMPRCARPTRRGGRRFARLDSACGRTHGSPRLLVRRHARRPSRPRGSAGSALWSTSSGKPEARWWRPPDMRPTRTWPWPPLRADAERARWGSASGRGARCAPGATTSMPRRSHGRHCRWSSTCRRG